MISKETIYLYRDKEVRKYNHGWDRTEREHWKAGFNSAVSLLYPLMEILHTHLGEGEKEIFRTGCEALDETFKEQESKR